MDTLKFLNYYLSPEDKFCKVDMLDGYHNFFVNKGL